MQELEEYNFFKTKYHSHKTYITDSGIYVKAQRRINLKGNGSHSFKGLAKLYIDFNREYETNLYNGQWVNTIQLLCLSMKKIYPKNSVKTFYYRKYVGKSFGGEALFIISKKHLFTFFS